MEEMNKHHEIGRAARKSDMDRKTARKYIRAGKMPSELAKPRTWRTRDNPFDAEDWESIISKLCETPELDAKTLFDDLMARRPERYFAHQLRTLQRHVRQWRAAEGPAKEIFFAQQHRAGEAAQTDFTDARELGVTIAGQLFVHLLCVFVLPFSNWQWATVCLSESLVAIRRGVQAALFQLGHVPLFHQTDHSTAATHRIPKAEQEIAGAKARTFNTEYLALMRHFSMTPRTTGIGKKEQNGDVEASNRTLKHRLAQALMLRGSADFCDRDAWQDFVNDVLRKANQTREPKVREELTAMRVVRAERLPEFTEVRVAVSAWSTIRVRHCAYSVPSRLIGHDVRVRVFEDHLEVYFADSKPELTCERLVGRGLARIDYRHMIPSLVRKPGAFARYVYREELFPSLVFRRAYDVLQNPHRGTAGDLEYLRILHLAARTMETHVEAALVSLMNDRAHITYDAVKAIVLKGDTRDAPPELGPLVVDLASYDALLQEAS